MRLRSRPLRIIKPEIRVVGIDDGKFVPRSKDKALVVGVVFRGGYWLDGIMSTYVAVDGLEGTDKIASMIKASPHYRQLRVIMLNGITFAGFNVVDIKSLNDQTHLPVLAITDKKPDLNQVHAAINHLPNSEERWKAIQNAGEIFSVVTRGEKQRVYVEAAGLSRELTAEVLRLTASHSKVPEALRVAHLVASGISNAQ